MKGQVFNAKESCEVMKPALTILLIMMISFSSAYTFCDNGNQGDLKISKLVDNLDDNIKAWEWREGQDISLSFNVANSLDENQEVTAEIIFLDDENEKIGITRGTLEEDDRIDDKDNEDIDFSFELDGDLPYASSYDMFVKVYGDDEDSQCYQIERKVLVNAFGACENSNLTIAITDYPKTWMIGDEEEITIEVKSSRSKNDYDIELILYNDDSEIETVSHNEDISNGTSSFDFDIKLEEDIEEGKYGLYVKISDGNDCSESRVFETYEFDYDHKISYRYNIISVKETPGIIVESVEGLDEIILGNIVSYKVNLKNTGEDESQVEVFAYSSVLGLKESEVIKDFKEGTIRSINISFLTSGKLGKTTLNFFADYEYVKKSDYYRESSSVYNHDLEKKITVIAAAPGSIVIINKTVEVNVTANVTVNVTIPPVVIKEGRPAWINMLIMFFIVVAVGFGIKYYLENY